jgi:hypothetical protein
MYSLTLGFIVFLSIAARLPYYKEYNDNAKLRGFNKMALGMFNVPID